MKKEQLKQLVTDLISDGLRLASSGQLTNETYLSDGERVIRADGESHNKWHYTCLHLIKILGSHGAAFTSGFSDSETTKRSIELRVGVLRAILAAIEGGLLLQIEDLIRAEAFADFLEQAKYLQQEGFHIPAAGLARSVLEQHLQKWCDREGCIPVKPGGKPPMINDYNMELYKQNKYDKITMQHVTGMAAIGNDAAHGKPVDPKDVERLIRDVTDFIARNPI